MTGKRIAAAAVLLLLILTAVLVGCLKPLYAAYRAYEASFGDEAQATMDEIRAQTENLLSVCEVGTLRQAASSYDQAESPADRRDACLAMLSAAQTVQDASPLTLLLTAELNRLSDALSDTPHTAAAAAEFNRLRNAIPARWFCVLLGIGEV